MAEPKTIADRLNELAPGLRHWTIHDERIDFRSEAYAVRSSDGTVLVDPLPLAPRAARALDSVEAACITGAFHQRSAWSFRRRTGCEVWAPADAPGLDERPDREYGDGEHLPGGLKAHDLPGPTVPHFVLSHAASGALFLADLLMRVGDGGLRLVPEEHHDDPARTRRSVERLSAIPARWLCPAHGAPLAADASARQD
ncbi:MAG: MBL fold metallo-hydrolase [bacterium]|nr:MBL fold metallo-hydrolase [bacterium]